MHLRAGGQDYIGCIPEFAPLTKNILIQSRRLRREGDEVIFPIKGGDWIPALPDEEGVQDWKAVFAAFQKQGYDGLVTVIENSWPFGHRKEVARRCAEILPRLWREASEKG